MRKYKFLLKPLFFIFSLLFATWLVIVIEKVSPSDFGKYRSLFEQDGKRPAISTSGCTARGCISNRKAALKEIFAQYKMGLTDSLSFDEQLDFFLKNFQGGRIAHEKKK